MQRIGKYVALAGLFIAGAAHAADELSTFSISNHPPVAAKPTMFLQPTASAASASSKAPTNEVYTINSTDVTASNSPSVTTSNSPSVTPSNNANSNSNLGFSFAAAPTTGFSLDGGNAIGVVNSGIENFTFGPSYFQSNKPFVMPGVDPVFVTCPVSNCPTDHPILSAQNIWGQTLYGSDTPQWESVIGLVSSTGHPNGQNVTQYLGGMQAPGSGTMWTLNTDIVRNATPGGPYSFGGQAGSGVPGQPGGIGIADGTIGYELDLSNWSEDDAPGNAFVVGMYINTLSTYSSLAGIYLDNAAGMASNVAPSWHDGIFFTGNSVKDNTIFDGSHASFGYQSAGQHIASFYDNSVSQYALVVNGTHTTADIALNDAAPIGLAIGGSYSAAAIIINANQKVCMNGTTSCTYYDGVNHKWVFTNSTGASIASIDDNGNLIVKGTISQNGTP